MRMYKVTKYCWKKQYMQHSSSLSLFPEVLNYSITHFVQVFFEILHLLRYIFIIFFFCKLIKYRFNDPIFKMSHFWINSVFMGPGTSITMRHDACGVPFACCYNVKKTNFLINILNQIRAKAMSWRTWFCWLWFKPVFSTVILSVFCYSANDSTFEWEPYFRSTSYKCP